MRNFSTIFIMLSIFVSIFDVIDTNDILLKNKPIFQSSSELDNPDNVDDLDIDLDNIRTHKIQLFNISNTFQLTLLDATKSYSKIEEDNFKLNNLHTKLKRPPIII